jgi:hypothetical protein
MTELELRIENLLFSHREVRKEKVGKCIMKFVQKENVAPIEVGFFHMGKYVLDEHHRVVAQHF